MQSDQKQNNNVISLINNRPGQNQQAQNNVPVPITNANHPVRASISREVTTSK
jgi:hypothetical protein